MSWGSHAHIQHTLASCDRARNERQKSVFLSELARLQTERAAELYARSMTLLQQSAATVGNLKKK